MGMDQVRAVAGSLVVAVLVMGCNPAAEPVPSVAPNASDKPVNAACSGIDLRSPSGNRVDLTGVWRGTDLGLYDLQQEGPCLFWFGSSQNYGSEPGDWWANVFTGTIHPDFTISGAWGDVPYAARIDDLHEHLGDGELVLAIRFDVTDGVEQTYLDIEQRSGGFGADRFVREAFVSEPTEFIGTFGADETGCLWIEASGGRYQFDPGNTDVFFRDTPLSLQDYTGHIVFRPGDPIRVVGQLSPLLGSGCQASLILAGAITAPPPAP